MISVFNPWVIGSAALVALGLAVGSYFYGRSDGRALCEGEHNAAAVKQAERALAMTQAGQKAADAATGKAVVVIEKVRTQTVTIIRKVPVHVTPEIDARYPWPVGAQRVHDAAVSGLDVSEIPLAPGKSDADASDVRPSQALAVIAGNYGNCRETREQVIGLQNAWRDAEAAMAGGP